jgi:hypothetical protein
LAFRHIPPATNFDVLSHLQKMAFIEPALTPFFEKRIEQESQ